MVYLLLYCTIVRRENCVCTAVQYSAVNRSLIKKIACVGKLQPAGSREFDHIRNAWRMDPCEEDAICSKWKRRLLVYDEHCFLSCSFCAHVAAANHIMPKCQLVQLNIVSLQFALWLAFRRMMYWCSCGYKFCYSCLWLRMDLVVRPCRPHLIVRWSHSVSTVFVETTVDTIVDEASFVVTEQCLSGHCASVGV